MSQVTMPTYRIPIAFIPKMPLYVMRRQATDPRNLTIRAMHHAALVAKRRARINGEEA